MASGSDPFFDDLPPAPRSTGAPHPIPQKVDPSFRFVIRGVLWLIYLAVVVSLIVWWVTT